jgi:hypothetical protein
VSSQISSHALYVGGAVASDFESAVETAALKDALNLSVQAAELMGAEVRSSLQDAASCPDLFRCAGHRMAATHYEIVIMP